ncbi:MAG: type II secretion system F family protein [Phycisphaerales bacterium]|nr:MAG: type II secretion system F family protein [Phycisphaerales bacterium]
MRLAYEAMDSRGGTRSEVLEVASPEEAMDLIRREGLFLTKLTPVRENKTPESVRPQGVIRRRLLSVLGQNHRQLVLFSRQMAMLTGVGTGVVPALDALYRQGENLKWREALKRIHDDVERGTPLATALQQEPELFNEVFCSMVAAGEATASLPTMLNRLSALATQQWQVRNRVLGAALYPMVLVAISTAVITMLILFVIPRFAGLFETLHVEVPASTAQLLKLSHFLTVHGTWVGGAAAGIMIGAALLLRTQMAREGIGWLSIRLPVLGKLTRSLILARLCRLLGVMVQAHVPLLESVDLALRATRHREYRDLMNRVRDAVTEGHPMATALGGSHLVPPAVTQGVSAGEQSGTLAEALIFMADWMDEENSQLIASLSKIFEPLVLIFMGLVVGGVAISLFMPLFDMATAAAG